MADDIVPEMLAAIEKDFKRRYAADDVIQEALKMIEAGNSTYKLAYAHAEQTGRVLARVLQDHLSSDVLPNGRMYPNIAERILAPMLVNNQDLIARATANVQTDLNRAAGLGIRGIEPPLNQDRVDGLIKGISQAEKYDDVAWKLDEPVVNFSESVVDDTVRENADFHTEAGLSPKIIRTSVGNCCDWCNEVAGTHEYEDVSDTGNDVFRRHAHCRCTVEYDPGDGSKRQNVHTKRVSGSNEDRDMRIRQAQRWEENDKVEREKRKQARMERLEGGKNKLTPEQRAFIVDLEYSPDKLAEYTPEQLKAKFESLGFEVKPLGRGDLKNIPFESGGGYRINYGGDSYLQYHPDEGSHHGEAYYKFSDGRRGRRRHNLDGSKKED
ncbi:MAG: hypothetical protein QM296_00505 [Bacillota bacterium]|nr:hypothetical protein [Bacillota bacterium]